MHPLIQKAINQLNSNNYRGYFEEMDSIIPPSISTEYQELKVFFVMGTKNEEFKEALMDFAVEVNEKINKS